MSEGELQHSRSDSRVISDLKNLECITLFVEDLAAAKRFYQNIFATKPVFEDANCTVLGLENVMLNLLKSSEAGTLITPAPVAGSTAGSRLMFTIKVTDVDRVCQNLRTQGADLLNGPTDRPWGRRTASFRDPDGNVWEVAQET